MNHLYIFHVTIIILHGSWWVLEYVTLMYMSNDMINPMIIHDVHIYAMLKHRNM